MRSPQVRPLDGFVLKGTGGYNIYKIALALSFAGGMYLPDRRLHLRMSVPITFRDQAEQECRDYEYRYSSLNRSEAKSLPQLVKFEAPATFNQGTNLSKCVWLKTVASIYSCLVSAVLGKRASLVSECFDGIQVGCAIGGIEAEADADC
jgi:hypothetical protein